jgi:hypothetical protein
MAAMEAHQRPKPLLPDPARTAAVRVIYANPKLTAEFNRAANLPRPEDAQRALNRIVNRVLAATGPRHYRAPRRRGAGRPAARRVVRTRGGDGGDDSDSDGPGEHARVGGALVVARRGAA